MKNVAIDADLLNALSRPFLTKAAEVARTAFNAAIDEMLAEAVGEKKSAPKAEPAKRYAVSRKGYRRMPAGKSLTAAILDTMNGAPMTPKQICAGVATAYGRKPPIQSIHSAVSKLLSDKKLVREGAGIYRKAAQ